ncbi:hypothetical protein LSO07_19440 [Janthinobacterium sp. PLB04]|uniref:Uncharacterized protein n=1 Tax=Janthinobacterium lividum TaxID=29581 RepID=A0AAJ4T3V8_9BURK|nr:MULTISPECIES: hypothetical protein [Janthinobacterium]KAB0325738.1 hypothetical protein F3B38_19150 [Janthinobacterium lividum]QSX94851.1 hypothetical protein J3P46_19310 [Janthinobacterium lividum]UGQ34666.1 hypothetical protein LSO07_19440 [Janthinobacterium sp. PLB04]
MFQLFGFGGARCPRCEHKNGAAAGYCAQCGLSLGAPDSDAVLHANQWHLADGQLALFFGVRELSSLFGSAARRLQVPAESRAWIVQSDAFTLIPAGDYDSAAFFARLPALLPARPAEVLIARADAVSLEFDLPGMASTERLNVAASLRVDIALGQPDAFARQFMRAPGAVTRAHLHALLLPSVCQIALEFIGSRALREMEANADLRPELNERLQSALTQRLASSGLAVARVETLALRHDKREGDAGASIGTLWLGGLPAQELEQHSLERMKQLDQLYDEEEWQRIRREELAARHAHRRAELQQDATVEKAELNHQEAERLQALRGRQIDLYGRILEAKSRRQALDHGAALALGELEQELAQKGAQRADEAANWEHVRALAAIKMRSELELSQLHGREQIQLAQQRFTHQVHLQSIAQQVESALLIDDETGRRTQLARLRQAEADAAQREAQLEAEQHQAAWQGLMLANAARKREAERVQEWEDQMQLARQRELLRAEAHKDEAAQVQAAEIAEKVAALRRGGAREDAIAQQEKLLRTIEADGVHARQLQQQTQLAQLDALAIEEQRQQLRQLEQEAQWQRDLLAMAQQRESDYARWKGEYEALLAQQAHAAELARIDIDRIEKIGSLSDTGKVAMAAGQNAAALAQVLKVQLQAGMSAEQIHALAALAAAENSVAPLDAMRMAQDSAAQERSYLEGQAERERRQQLDLVNLQNAAHAHGLSAQAQLGVAVAQALQPSVGLGAAASLRCKNGHAQRAGHPEDKFCAACGVALQP